MKQSTQIKLRKTPAVVLSLFLAGAVFASNSYAEQKKEAKPAAEKVVKADDKTDKAANKSADNKSLADIKIGFVNTEKILRDSKPAKEAQKKIEEEFKKRDTDLQKLASELRKKYEDFDKNSPVMNDEDRNKAQSELTDLDTQLQRKRREFQEDFNRRRNEAFSTIVDHANTAIHNIAAENDYDLILQDAVTVSERIDITDKVIQALDKK
ncbi:OmpH family outer membrane protein [Brackiella oedipodis]|uniref:OmpH family outer membrane protein n=1 Tax=Brackiella oedipodis TaxID=124225 RepID=UPI00056F1A02|nr:OmpH family outer membrane protein [Brackiella oedipodis]